MISRLFVLAALVSSPALADDVGCGRQLILATGSPSGVSTIHTILNESPVSDGRMMMILAAIESGFRTNARSDKNAFGLMQVTIQAAHHVQAITKMYKKTARNFVLSTEYGYYVKEWLQYCSLPEPSEAVLMNPRWSVRYGGCYLRYQLRLNGGNLPLALAAYNGGYVQASRLSKQQAIHPETANYISKYYFLRASTPSCQGKSL